MSVSVHGQDLAVGRRWPGAVAVPVTLGLSLMGWWVIWQAVAALLRAML